jgi:dipeptidase E
MMKIWKKCEVDKILREAYQKGIVLSGVSAGSICWFRWGNSDSRRFANPNADLIKVSGLGLINALHCPHYDFEKDRKPDLKKMMKKTSGVAIAIDNCCAIEVIDDKYRIISSKVSANAYRVYWKANKYRQEKIKKEKEFRSLKELLKK